MAVIGNFAFSCMHPFSLSPFSIFFKIPPPPSSYSFLGYHLRRRSCPPGRGSAPPRSHTCRVVREINNRKGESQNIIKQDGGRSEGIHTYIHANKCRLLIGPPQGGNAEKQSRRERDHTTSPLLALSADTTQESPRTAQQTAKLCKESKHAIHVKKGRKRKERLTRWQSPAR